VRKKKFFFFFFFLLKCEKGVGIQIFSFSSTIINVDPITILYQCNVSISSMLTD
jgi:hypothetical protein